LRGMLLGRHGFLFLTVALLVAAGCQKTTRTNDPQLKPIQEMIDAQVPLGTPEAKVRGFLVSSGYTEIPAQKPGTVVATIHAAAAQQVPPVSARVTFYFDANGKLNTFELQRTAEGPHTQ